MDEESGISTKRNTCAYLAQVGFQGFLLFILKSVAESGSECTQNIMDDKGQETVTVT